MSLGVTHHAVQRFMKYWRVGRSLDDVETELRALAAEAVPTRRRTLPGDAWIYFAHSQSGERILLAVRDSAIVTVLAPDVDQDKRVEADIEMFEDSEATRLAIRTMLEADAREETESRARLADERDRKDNARACIARWKSGKVMVSRKALAKAHQILGLPFEGLEGLVGDVTETADTQLASEAARRQSALQLVAEWRSGRSFTPKAIKRAHDILGLPLALSGDTPEERFLLEQQTFGEALATKRVQARALIEAWKAGKSNASLKAVRRAYKLLDRPFDDERLVAADPKASP
jgi:hypothetical protein